MNRRVVCWHFFCAISLLCCCAACTLPLPLPFQRYTHNCHVCSFETLHWAAFSSKNRYWEWNGNANGRELGVNCRKKWTLYFHTLYATFAIYIFWLKRLNLRPFETFRSCTAIYNPFLHVVRLLILFHRRTNWMMRNINSLRWQISKVWWICCLLCESKWHCCAIKFTFLCSQITAIFCMRQSKNDFIIMCVYLP